VNSYLVELPIGMQLINANDRDHWRKSAGKTATIRSVARGQAKGIPRLGKVKIKVIYYAPDNRRRDTTNLFPSVKAAVDGIVDAGVLKDDSDKFVVGYEILRGSYNIPKGQLTIEIIEVDEGGLSV
jgi:Holliday junction resolvase RusA-like endonuclease